MVQDLNLQKNIDICRVSEKAWPSQEMRTVEAHRVKVSTGKKGYAFCGIHIYADGINVLHMAIHARPAVAITTLRPNVPTKNNHGPRKGRVTKTHQSCMHYLNTISDKDGEDIAQGKDANCIML